MLQAVNHPVCLARVRPLSRLCSQLQFLATCLREVLAVNRLLYQRLYRPLNLPVLQVLIRLLSLHHFRRACRRHPHPISPPVLLLYSRLYILQYSHLGSRVSVPQISLHQFQAISLLAILVWNLQCNRPVLLVGNRPVYPVHALLFNHRFNLPTSQAVNHLFDRR